MRHFGFLLLALTVSGCFSFPFVTKEEEKVTVTVQRPAVLPEQVKENNARRMAEALEEEVAVDETTPAIKPEDKEKDKDKRKK